MAVEAIGNTKVSVEMDESYFGAKRVRGIRGRGARGKHVVFCLIKRYGKVYTQVVESCYIQELYPIIEEHVSKDAVVYTDGFKIYDGLIQRYFKEYFLFAHERM